MEMLHAMEVFVKVAEVGSFTKAADAMEMSRPQASLTIQALEKSLGARLFHRTTRSVTLTAEGEVFYDHAKDILGSVSTATTLFGQRGRPVRGRLRIDLPSVFGQLGFVGALAEFAERHPDLELALGVTDRLVDLVAEGVDCAIRIGELASSSLVARRMGALRMLTCAAPSYLQRRGTPQSVEEVSTHGGVKFLSGMSRRALPWQFSVDGEDTPVTPKGQVSVNETHAYVQCGVAGFGLIQLPGFVVGRELAEGTLVEVLKPFRPRARPVSLLYPSRTQVAPQVKVFADWLHARFVQLQPDWMEA